MSVIQVDGPGVARAHAARGPRRATTWSGRWRPTGGRPPGRDRIQIHTHLCYSDADQILAAIDGLDADVTTIGSARSGARILGAVGSFGRGLGPGVYDIHSPRVPGRGRVAELLRETLKVLPAERVWVNPDCGLKTRTYEQVEAALANVVGATRRLRSEPGRWRRRAGDAASNGSTARSPGGQEPGRRGRAGGMLWLQRKRLPGS